MSSKFLEILEEHDPKNQSVLHIAWLAKSYLYESNVSFSSNRNEITLHTPGGDVILEVKGKGVVDAEEEDYEMSPNDIAQKVSSDYKNKSKLKRGAHFLANTGEKQVDRAVKGQEKMYPELAKYINDQTNAIRSAMRNAKHDIKLK